MHYHIQCDENITSCVYKLHYNGMYLIEKCKTLPVSVQKLQNGLNAFIKGTEKGRRGYNLAYRFFSYILWNEGHEVTVEVILESKNPYQLLKAEQIALDEAKSDPNCLNLSFDAYIPVHTQVNGVGSWINRGYYLNFCIWKKKRLNQSTIG
jgi:hypothetical protein